MSWKAEHDEYLRSSSWKRKRSEALSFYGEKCSCCDSVKGLQVHHISYITLNRLGGGKELMKELMPLCSQHHTLIHKLIYELLVARKNDPRYNWEKASREASNYFLSQSHISPRRAARRARNTKREQAKRAGKEEKKKQKRKKPLR